MQVTVEMTPRLDALLKRLGEDMEAGITAGMQYLLAELEAHAVKEAPVETSNLVNSITSYLTDKGHGGVIKATAPYAVYVHEGTGLYGPHKKEIVIRPQNAKALYWPGARHPVRKVVQKGQKPDPFFHRAIEKADIEGSFEAGISAYLRRRGW